MKTTIRLHLVLLISASVRIHAEPGVNAPISPDLFGGLVDIVTPGYQHWNAESGDSVDPTGDGDDFDNNFGEHKGRLDVVKLSRKTREYAQGTVDDESVYVDSASSLSWVFQVPAGGKYVFATRFWRELQDPTNVQVSYQARGKWIALPLIEKVEHWGGFSDLSCFLIDVSDGKKEIPFRVKVLSGRAQIHRMLLGKMRDESPFVSDKAPVHPSMHFRSGDIGTLRQKVKNGPPKLAFNYMTQQISWYTNTLNRGEKSWTPKGASHHVPRSIAQTAFMYVLTERQEYFETALRMMQTVMDWEVNENAIVDQKGAYNILGRGRVLSAMAMAYDWLYNKLSPRKRRRIRRHLDAEANRLFLYNETIVGNSSSNNWDPWIGAGYGMAGIALRDEHRWAGDWVASMKRIFRVNLHHSGEDFGYFNSGLIKSLDFGISLKTATGEDIFTAEKERLKTLLDYRTMLLEPLGERYAQFGDARGSNDPLLSLCLATCFEDPLAQWFIKHRSAGTADHMKSWAWNHMLPIAVVTLYDPLVKETGPNLPRMPLARSFANEPRLVPGVRGVTIMRTGYDRTADIQLALRCGDYGGWHGHPDQGSFVLNAYGDRMVVDFALGAPYGTPKNNFSKSALAHSGVLVDEKGQVEYSSPVFHNREAGRTGPLMHTRFIDHVMADMTVAFSKNRKIRKMEHAHRYFLFVRRPDHRAYIVVFDSLQMDQREHAWDWMLQTDTKHTIKADRPNHHVIQGKADLHVFTLEPKAVEMEKSDHFGLWRTMKLMNPDDVKHATFLHVLYPTEKGAPIPEIQRKASARAVGATVGEELFTFRRGAGVIALGGISTDGRIAGVSQKDGKLNWFLCVRGKSLEFGGKPVFLSDSPVTVAVDSFGSGTIIADQEAELTANIGGKELKLKASKGTSHLLNGKVKE